MKPHNPLFDKTRTPTVAKTAQAATSLSPITGKQMVNAYCGTIPVFVDTETRVVLPVKDTE